MNKLISKYFTSKQASRKERNNYAKYKITESKDNINVEIKIKKTNKDKDG